MIGAADTILAATQPHNGIDNVLDAATATIDRTLATNQSFAMAKDVSKSAARRPKPHCHQHSYRQRAATLTPWGQGRVRVGLG